MPKPTLSAVHVSRPLTIASVAMMNADEELKVVDAMFPMLPVDHQSDQYDIYSAADWLRVEAGIRAPGTESRGGGWDLTRGTYSCVNISVHKDLPYEIIENSDQDEEKLAAEYVAQQIGLKRNAVFIAKFFAASLWGRTRTGVALGPTGTQFVQWDQAASDPIADITEEADYIQSQTGRRPNRLMLGSVVFTRLKRNAAVLACIQYTQRAQLTVELLAGLFEVEKVVVHRVTQNTAVEGATAALSMMAGKHALLCFAAPKPSLMTPTGGYTFAWKNAPGSVNGFSTSRIEMPAIRSVRIEGDYFLDMKLVSSAAGTFFSGAVA